MATHRFRPTRYHTTIGTAEPVLTLKPGDTLVADTIDASGLDANEAQAWERGNPMTFLQAAAFQWINPKAWVIAVGAVSAYSQPAYYQLSVLVISAVMLVVTLPCIAVWTAFGSVMRKILRDPRAVRAFNIGMALLLVASLWPILAEFLRH